MDLFGLAQPEKKSGIEELYVFPSLPEMPDKEKLEKEKEVIGFYLSAQSARKLYESTKTLHNTLTFQIPT